MIDIEAAVFTPIAQAVRAQFPGTDVKGEYVRTPAKFPHVSIVESDNYTSVRHRDTSAREKYATVMYEVAVYSNKGDKKTEARTILKVIDDMMAERNFTRIAMTPVPNMEDASIYRLVARYRAETDGENLFRI